MERLAAATPPCLPGPASRFPWRQGSPRNALWWPSAGKALTAAAEAMPGRKEVAGSPLPPRGWPGARLPGTRTAPDSVQPALPGPTAGGQVLREPQQLPPQARGAPDQSLRPGKGAESPQGPERQERAATASGPHAHSPQATRQLLYHIGDSWGEGVPPRRVILPGPQQTRLGRALSLRPSLCCQSPALPPSASSLSPTPPAGAWAQCRPRAPATAAPVPTLTCPGASPGLLVPVPSSFF